MLTSPLGTLKSRSVEETGKGTGEGYTINIPLPPGSGSGAYRAAFERVVVPALESYKPQLILVSCHKTCPGVKEGGGKTSVTPSPPLKPVPPPHPTP